MMYSTTQMTLCLCGAVYSLHYTYRRPCWWILKSQHTRRISSSNFVVKFTLSKLTRFAFNQYWFEYKLDCLCSVSAERGAKEKEVNNFFRLSQTKPICLFYLLLIHQLKILTISFFLRQFFAPF